MIKWNNQFSQLKKDDRNFLNRKMKPMLIVLWVKSGSRKKIHLKKLEKWILIKNYGC
jgi:hypothetical protein